MKTQVQVTIDPEVLQEARQYIGYGNISSTVEKMLKKEIERVKRKQEVSNVLRKPSFVDVRLLK